MEGTSKPVIQMDGEDGVPVPQSLPTKENASDTVPGRSQLYQTGQNMPANEPTLELDTEVRMLRQTLDREKQKNKQLDNAKKTIKEELETCQDEMLALQPQRQVTDSQMLSKWNFLCGLIDQWSGDKSEHVDNLRELSSGEIPNGSFDSATGRLEKLGIENLTVSGGCDILDDVIRHVIHIHLRLEVLGESVDMLGLTGSEARLLTALERNLKSLEPRRDLAQIHLWKSETLQAMSASPEFVQRQDIAAGKITQSIAVKLGYLLPKIDSEALSELQIEVVGAAVKLATMIHCSTTDYYFVFEENSGTFIRNDLNSFEVRNASSERLVRPGTLLAMNIEDPIGERILFVQPALYRRRRGVADRLLQKGVILGRMFEQGSSVEQGPNVEQGRGQESSRSP